MPPEIADLASSTTPSAQKAATETRSSAEPVGAARAAAAAAEAAWSPQEVVAMGYAACFQLLQLPQRASFGWGTVQVAKPDGSLHVQIANPSFKDTVQGRKTRHEPLQNDYPLQGQGEGAWHS